MFYRFKIIKEIYNVLNKKYKTVIDQADLKRNQELLKIN